MRHLPAAARWLLLAGLLLTYALALAGRLEAQVSEGPSDAVLLARLCVSEAGLRAYAGDDCAAIHAVLAFRAALPAHRSVSYAEVLHRYSRRATVDREGRSRPWIAELEPSGAEPATWTPLASWPRCRRWWRLTLAHSRDVLAGRVTARCEPHSWARAGVRPADPSASVTDCGVTRNVFWRIARYAGSS